MERARIFATLFVLYIAGVHRVASTPTLRILGGEDAAVGRFPYAVSVRLDGAHNCGGSIITSRDILTAAHCVTEHGSKPISPNRLSVRVGSTNQYAGGKIVYVAAIAVHPEFGNYKNNIAIIKLENDLEFNDKTRSISIATSPLQQPPVDANVAVAGWGELSDGSATYKLQYNYFTVANASVCTAAYNDAATDSGTICLNHPLKVGSCRGDGGNGGAYNSRLVAVSNFVVGACGSRYPDVFTSVPHHADWIQSNLY